MRLGILVVPDLHRDYSDQLGGCARTGVVESELPANPRT